MDDGFTTMALRQLSGKTRFFTYPARKLDVYMHTLTLPRVKMNLKMITDPNVKLQITKSAEENIKENTLWFLHRQSILLFYECVYVFGLSIHVYRCTFCGRLRSISGVLINHSPPYFWQCIWLNLELTISCTIWPASSGILLSLSPTLKITDRFMWVLGIWMGTSCLHSIHLSIIPSQQKVLTPL